MLWEEAKQALAEGNRVRRPEWAKDKFIEMMDGNYIMDNMGWEPINEDATAKNWEAEGGRKQATKAEKEYAAAAGATLTNASEANGGAEVLDAQKEAQAKVAQRLGERQAEKNKKQMEQAKESDEKASKAAIEAAETPEQKKAIKDKLSENDKKEAEAEKLNKQALSDAKKAEKDNEGSDSSKNDSIA